MAQTAHEMQINEELGHSFYNIEKFTKDIKDDEEQPRVGFVHDLAKEGRMSVHNVRGLSGMTPTDYAKKISEMLDEQTLMNIKNESLRNERDQIDHLLAEIG